MSARLGWGLALAALALGGALWGWQGLALASSAVVFWLLLQLSRAMRVMRRAGEAPVGRVDSAVMLGAKLSQGLTLLEVVALTRSLGEPVGAPEHETWRWQDAGGDRIELRFADGRLKHWELQRAEPPPDVQAPPGADAPTPLIPPGGGAT